MIGSAIITEEGRTVAKGSTDAVERRYINPEQTGTPYDYTHVVTVRGGRTVYVAGQTAYDEINDTIKGGADLGAQAQASCEHLRIALRAAGAEPTDVVRVGIYIKNHTDAALTVARECLDGLFPLDRKPANTILGVQALALEDLLFEIDAVAVVED